MKRSILILVVLLASISTYASCTVNFTLSEGWSNTNCVLPVELLHFTVRKHPKGIHLSWATAQEINNKEFIVQRSKEGSTWEDLVIIEGKKNTTETQDYEFVDMSPHEGDNYYRLKQIDFDGQFEIFQIVVVNTKNFNKFLEYDILGRVLPNPNGGYIYIRNGKKFFVRRA